VKKLLSFHSDTGEISVTFTAFLWFAKACSAQTNAKTSSLVDIAESICASSSSHIVVSLLFYFDTEGLEGESIMSKSTVLLIGPLAHTDEEWSALGGKYTLKEFRTGNREQFLSKLKDEFSDVVGLYRSNNSVAQTGPFDAEVCAALPKSLKFIAHNGAGYDNIDVEAFTKKGIQISSTPIAVDNATADVGIFLLLGALRYATIPLNAIRAGTWRGATPIGHDPEGKVLGILGMGGIGRVSAFRLHENMD
jgi:hypothetical protein